MIAANSCRFLTAILMFAIIVSGQLAWAKMYQWKDDNGKVHYTDNPGAIPPRFRIQIEMQLNEDLEGDKGEASGQTPLHTDSESRVDRCRGDPTCRSAADATRAMPMLCRLRCGPESERSRDSKVLCRDDPHRGPHSSLYGADA